MTSFTAYLESSLDVLKKGRRALGPVTIENAFSAVTAALTTDKPLLIYGNGGSATHATHIAGELVSRLLKERAP